MPIRYDCTREYLQRFSYCVMHFIPSEWRTVDADFERSTCVRHQLEAVGNRYGAVVRRAVVYRAARVFEWREKREALRPARHEVRVGDGVRRQQQVTGAVPTQAPSARNASQAGK